VSAAVALADCFATHEQLKDDDHRWVALQYVGDMITPADDTGPEEVLELRNCPTCNSTLAKVVDRPGVRTLGHANQGGQTVTVTLALNDAMAIGFQLTMQGHTSSAPADARAVMTRVGEQLVSAAKLARKASAS
jgi:hypothetical protein